MRFSHIGWESAPRSWALAALLLVGTATTPAFAERTSAPPQVQSRAAVVLDARTGTELWGKNPDEPVAIASTTKVFVALAVRHRKIALDGWTTISRDDARASRGGARTRLDVGQSFKNVDLLRAMLISSDNRAPTALGRAAGLSSDQLIAEMNQVARRLGLKKTRFTDTSGLRGNVSTAREMGMALRAALADPVLAEIMRTKSVEVKSRSGYAKIRYNTTNEPLAVSKYHVTGGKTGYTDAAGYCFVTGAKIDDRPYVMAFLGAQAKYGRFADFDRVAAWLDAGAPGSARAPRAAAANRVSPKRTRAVANR